MPLELHFQNLYMFFILFTEKRLRRQDEVVNM